MSDVNATTSEAYPYAPEPTPAGMPPRFVEQAKSGPSDDSAHSRAQQGLGPFTLREWIVLALGTALIVLSFFSAFTIEAGGTYTPVWALGLTAVGAVLLPFVGILLMVLRRFSPRLQNVGGLGIDQFCSVSFVVAALVWLNLGIILSQVTAAIGGLVDQFAGGLLSGVPLPFDPANLVNVSPIVWIAFVVALAGVFFTVFARFVPPFSADFTGREEVAAHSTARPARPIAKRTRQPKPQHTPAQAFPPAGQQPAYAGQQPAYGGQQPPYAGQQPAYGGQQPSYAGQQHAAQPPFYGTPAPSGYGQPAPVAQAPQGLDPFAQGHAAHAPGTQQPAPQDPGVVTPAPDAAPAGHDGTAPGPETQAVPAPFGEAAPSSHSAAAPVEHTPAAAPSGAPRDIPVDAPSAESEGADAESAEAEGAGAEAVPGVADVSGDDSGAADQPASDDVAEHVVDRPTDESLTAEPVVDAQPVGTEHDATQVASTEPAEASSSDVPPSHGAAEPQAASHTEGVSPQDDAPQDAAYAHDAAAASVAGQPNDAAPVIDASASTVTEQPAAAQQVPASQPFWALVPVERDVHDFDGHPIYKIGPTAWALVLEDRGSYFVMRHDDGRIGYLHDVTGITRG